MWLGIIAGEDTRNFFPKGRVVVDDPSWTTAAPAYLLDPGGDGQVVALAVSPIADDYINDTWDETIATNAALAIPLDPKRDALGSFDSIPLSVPADVNC